MNPYLKNKTFVKKSFKAGAEVSYVAKKPNSNERYVGANDEINAGSKAELAQMVASLQADVQSGRVITPSRMRRHEAVQRIMAEKKDMVTAAVNEKNADAWQALGAVMGDEITTAGEREGFADNLLVNQTLGAGDIARFRVKEKQVTGWQAISPARIAPSVVRQAYVYPEEFYILVNIQVEEKEILQNPGDILEEKLGEGIEQTMVVKDRILKSILDRAAMTANTPFYYNSFTPIVMQSMKTQVAEWGLTTGSMLIAFDVWNDIIADPDFVNFFDQISKHELIVNGAIASLLGVNIHTDGFREPHLKVLNRGEVYILAQPGELGGTTLRGDLVTEPTKGYNQGQPWRGWFQSRITSLVVPNARGVCRAQRT